jgi:uncharacterized protein YkwD
MKNPQKIFLIVLLLCTLALVTGCPVRVEPPADTTPTPTPGITPPEEQVTTEEVPTTPISMEEAVFDEVNRRRTDNNLPPLEFETTAFQAAKYHSINMVRQGFFAHESPRGQDHADRLRLFGFNHVGRVSGENLATNLNIPNPVVATVDGWMDSPGHRRNILNEMFEYGAVGIEQDERGQYYYTQVFWGGRN